MVLHLRLPSHQLWQRAKCAIVPVTRDYDPFFTDTEHDEAIKFCNGDADGNICPIRHECLLFALTNNEKDGVWGGTSEVTRKAIRKRYPLKRGKEPRAEWRWQTEQEALNGLDVGTLRAEIEAEKQIVSDD